MPNPTNPQDDIDFSQYLDVILRRRWIVAATSLLTLAATAFITYTTDPIFEAKTLLVIEKERSAGAEGNSSLVENSNEDYYHTQYQLLQSRSLMENVYRVLQLDKIPEFSNPNGVKKLLKAVSVQPVPRSRLVYINVESREPALAAKISNLIAETFVKQNLENQLFISKEVLTALQVQKGRAGYDALPAVVNNPLIQSLKGDYAKQLSALAELSRRYTPKHPAYMSARSNLVALETQIQSETDRIVSSLKTELSGRLKGNNVRVIDPAITPDQPIRPKPVTNLIIGGVVGLMLSILLAFAIETLDQTIRTQEDVEFKLAQPFLGTIPQTNIHSGKSYGALVAKELSLTSEAFRNLRTMVDFAGVGGKAKGTLVTSTIQGEGKTHVASNLAVALSQLGEKVLLIDGDLRRPALHKTFRLSSANGLSDYLLSSRHPEDVQGVIQATDVEGLSLLPCGQRPPNPSELLNTPRLGGLVAWARENFDRVIVDCTPMYPINDTLLWGRHISSSIFVVRFGVTRTPLIKNACQKLRAGAVKILGIAVNAAKSGGLAYASYNYYYQHYYQADERSTAKTV